MATASPQKEASCFPSWPASPAVTGKVGLLATPKQRKDLLEPADLSLERLRRRLLEGSRVERARVDRARVTGDRLVQRIATGELQPQVASATFLSSVTHAPAVEFLTPQHRDDLERLRRRLLEGTRPTWSP